uniref:Protein Nef n=1 Tax=Human immunodeficiency virus type 1 TaxID=11676 RepID=A0A248X9P1_HV1|nr:nef protein [Human immunodeficiency virus 1]
MGGKWSKSSIVGWPKVRERIRQTPPAAIGVGAAYQELDRHGAITSSNTADPNPDKAWLEAQEETEEKGAVEGLVYSKKRQEILDLWVYHTQGYFPDWQNYTPGPGIRFPLTFGWCFKLVPMDPVEIEEANKGENNSLLHPICQHGMEDEEREVLIWRFDSSLAFKHRAREMHPEFYKDC